MIVPMVQVAHNAKPRVVRGSERLETRLSELAGLVLAEHGSKQLVLSSHNLVRATYMARTSLG